MRRSTLNELCGRYGIEPPPDTRGQVFDNFGGFNAVYWSACECIRTPDDLARVILEVAEDARSEGAWWIEPAFDGDRFTILRERDPLFDSPEDAWHFALDAAQTASRVTGVGIGFISAIDRTRSVAEAMDRATLTAKLAAAGDTTITAGAESAGGPYRGIVGLGLHGNEQGYPPEPFADAFRIGAYDAGLISAPHAGEIAPTPGGGPASVRSALDQLGAHRILHGVLASSDANLVERLARERICLDVCPSSNIQLSVYPSLADHPLPLLLAAGVPCTLGSDDPLLFGPNLVDEFSVCRSEMGLNDTELGAMARTSFEFSGAPEPLKQAGYAAIDAWLSAE